MSGRRGGKTWSASELKKRGWNNDLIRELLPKPRVICYGGRKVRVWDRDEVRRGEEHPRFAHRTAEDAARTRAPTQGMRRTGMLLERAWAAEVGEDSAPWRLAEHWHRGLLASIPAKAKAYGLRTPQASAWLGEFLSLERRCDSKRLPEVFRGFLRCCGWLGENTGHPLAQDVLAHYPQVLLQAARQAASDFASAQPEADLEGFLLHLGGTNTGKTYAGFQRLIRAETGVYLAPLRLLALEAQETLIDAGVECSLSTGEEEDIREGDTHTAATAEKLDLKRHWDVAVIDECQLIADPQRGYAWTRAILGVLAPEVHLCAAPEAKELLIRLIESCGDRYEVEVHRRKTPLVCMERPMDYQRVQPGDALITFSKVGVLSVAEDLRQNGKEPAIIYGALPYATRRKQMEGFLQGRMEYIVSTDAIGMGLNLPIRRIIFMETEKFDGVERRELRPEEIRQIAGRAGRYGIYHKGYVGATQNLELIRAGLEAVIPPLEYAVAGFSDLVLQVEFDLLEVLTQWNALPTVEPYRRLDISRYIAIISKLRELGFTLTKEQELRAANIPFDETDDALRELFFALLRRWQQGEPVEQPGQPEDTPTLPELELYYRKLDLYFSFSKAFGCPVDEDRLYNSRERVAEEINEILLHRLRTNIRFCTRCGKALPLHHRGRLCDVCFQKERRPGRNPRH